MVDWLTVDDPSAYAREVLQEQAPEIPVELVVGRAWGQEEIALERLSIDGEMVARHDLAERHVRRRDGFVERIGKGVAIPPLVALGDSLHLVDGYARYRALVLLKVEVAQVLRQL